MDIVNIDYLNKVLPNLKTQGKNFDIGSKNVNGAAKTP